MADLYDATVTDGIAASSKNPGLAGIWLEFLRVPETVEKFEADKEAQRQKDMLLYGTEEMLDLAYEMGNNGVVDAQYAYPGLDKIVQAMADDIEKSSTQAANEYKEAGQAIVDEVNNMK